MEGVSVSIYATAEHFVLFPDEPMETHVFVQVVPADALTPEEARERGFARALGTGDDEPWGVVFVTSQSDEPILTMTFQAYLRWTFAELMSRIRQEIEARHCSTCGKPKRCPSEKCTGIR